MESDPAANLETEIDLLRRTGQGDRRSFEQLYERFSGVLFSTAYRVLNSPEAAEDVLQDVFIQIWEKAPLYDPRARQTAYVGGHANA
jgi:RNA polymerase sigma-70 factor (ECF subfamily)